LVTFGAVLNACRGAQQLDVVERLLQAIPKHRMLSPQLMQLEDMKMK